MTELSILRPDDWHLHLRDHDMLAETVPASARCFHRAVVMPNLVPPITDGKMALAYQNRILERVPAGESFQPLMTLYLQDTTTAQMVADAKTMGVVACKLYPAGATTHSEGGLRDLDALQGVFEQMAEEQLPLLIHGEVTDSGVDIFDREKEFIHQKLVKLVDRNPQLKIVLEHITTKEAVDFVEAASSRVAATVTPQHLMLNRNHLLVGGIRPHNYCLPILKRRTHQEALRKAVASGTPKIFLGTDSAPHIKGKKEAACGCAGCYSAWSAIELYAQVFEELGALEKLENFASVYGPRFYQLPVNHDRITLVKEPWQIPEEILMPHGEVIIPFLAGQTVAWRLASRPLLK